MISIESLAPFGRDYTQCESVFSLESIINGKRSDIDELNFTECEDSQATLTLRELLGVYR